MRASGRPLMPSTSGRRDTAGSAAVSRLALVECPTGGPEARAYHHAGDHQSVVMILVERLTV